MTTEMGTPPPASAPRNQRNLIIAVVVGLAVLCCCCVALGAIGWACGDVFMGVATSCSF